jgi:hypothetical protein
MPETDRYAARIAAGDCTTCGRKKAEADRTRTRCASCRKQARLTERARREDRIARNKCRTCGERPPEEGRNDCRPCLDRYAGYMRGRG